MKKILFVFICITICSCDFLESKTTVKKENTNEKYFGTDIQIITFDNCEYVKFGFSDSSWGSHKGNCKNPIHNLNK